MFVPIQTLTVGELTQHVKSLIEGDLQLAAVSVRGEITGWNRAASGHIYFSLKDAQAQVRAVIWKSSAGRLTFDPANGQQVVATGRMVVFEPAGNYQLQVSELKRDGLGALYAAFLERKERLAREGLFDEARKRPICTMPKRIGLVTSPTGAALQDMLVTLKQRHPGVDVVLSPALVQGADAPASLQGALRRLWRLHAAGLPIDTIVVARGGGSFEDLNAFNDEGLLRVIAESPIPVITGVGHETDTTLIDYVADVRAVTPTAAAARAVPNRSQLAGELEGLGQALLAAMQQSVQGAHRQLEVVRGRLRQAHPVRRIEAGRQLLDYRQQRLVDAFKHILGEQRLRFGRAAARLDALSPLQVLGRGFAVCRTADQQLLRSVESVAPGASLEVRLVDGCIDAQVIEIRPL
jgi:exodeoxyribonuclease VII large subunit